MQAEPETSLVGEEYEVEVGPVAHGGHCIARTDEGQVLFVRHTLPGERVVARVTEGEEGARFLRADAVRILTPSKDRVEAPCPFSGPGRCGGCDWQHAAPGAQRRLKAEVIAEQLQRLAGLTPRRPAGTAPSSRPPATSCATGEVPAWRTRVQYAVDADGSAGLRRHRSHEVEPIDHCMIAAPGVSELGIEAARLAEHRHRRGDRRRPAPGPPGRSSSPAPGRAGCPSSSSTSPVSVLRVDEHDGGSPPRPRPRLRARARRGPHLPGRQRRLLAGPPEGRRHSGRGRHAGPDAAQGRHGARPLLRRRPVRRAPSPSASASRARSSASSRASARSRTPGTTSRTCDRVRIEQGKVEQVLPRTGITEADLIVLDPPRAGAGRKTVAHLAVPGRPPDRLRRLRPGGARPRPRVLPRGGLQAARRCGPSTSSR